MKFVINRELFENFDDLFCGVVIAKNIKKIKENEFVDGFKKNIVQSTCGEMELKDIKKIVPINKYRKVFDEMGINPDKYKNSVEELLLCVLKNKEIPTVSDIVDIVNSISVKYKLAIGAHDIDTFDYNNLEVRYANDLDNYYGFEEKEIEAITSKEIVYVCNHNIRTRGWIWKQNKVGRICNKSKNIVFSIHGFIDNKEAVVEATNELESILKNQFDAEVSVTFLDKNTNDVLIGTLSDEEKLIEEQIKILLKGAADFSDVYDIKEKLREVREEGRSLRIKLGLDPSAPDIHLGHAVVLRKIKQLQDLGHNAIIIIGDFTGRIGDPTGKSKIRKQLSDEEVKRNAKTYTEQVFKILDPNKTEIRFNSEWLGKMNFEDVIKLSSITTVARMLERDDFKNRYNNELPIYIHEFFYPLMQGYDSVEIKADIELGGTDQKFNVLMGRNIQKSFNQKPQLTLFMPLLEGIDGNEKMSKSLGNYIGINEEASEMYEKVMKIPDDMIIKYYELCTDIHPDIIDTIKKRIFHGVNPRDIKMELALEITRLYHGKNEAEKAQKNFIDAFQVKVAPINIQEIILSYECNKLEIGECLVEEIFNQLDRFKSKSEIRRLFKQNAVSIGEKKVIDPKQIKDIVDGTIIQIGKGKFYKIKYIK